MKRILASVAAATAVLLMTAHAPAWAQRKVVIGHFGDPAPYKAIVADGSLDKATGWTIEWRKFDSGAEVNAAMASGGIVLSEIGSVPLAAGASQGLDYQLISVGKSIVSSEALVSRNGAGIESPADLKGKRIAVPVGSTAHFSLMGAMKKFGLTDKDVRVVGMSPPEIAAAWSQNAIDAAFIWEPVQTRLRENGKVMITAGEVAKEGFPTFNAWVANTKFSKENKAGVIAFLKAMNEINGAYIRNAAAWTADSPQIKAIAANVGATPADTVVALKGAFYPDADALMTPAWLANGGATPAQAMKSTAEFLKSAGRIGATAASYAPYINVEYANAAAGR